MNFGDKLAMTISRFMGRWTFLIVLMIIIEMVIIYFHLIDGAALDVFNLMISLYTLFVDLIILKANNTLNDKFFELMNRILTIEETIAAQNIEMLRNMRGLQSQIDRLYPVVGIPTTEVEVSETGIHVSRDVRGRFAKREE